MAKYGMSMCVLGMAEELKPNGIAVNALWPKTAIMTAAMEMLGGEDVGAQCRKPEIMADAAYAMFCRDSKSYTGNFAVDEEVLKSEGISDFENYAVVPGSQLLPDFFLDEFFDAVQQLKPAASQADNSQGGGGSELEKLKQNHFQIFSNIEAMINPEIIEKTKAVYTFEVTGDEPSTWFLDLKEGGGSCGKGQPPNPADVTLTLSSANMVKMFQGSLKATNAFMTGKLKISGDMGKAMKLEKLMGKLKSKL
ncbi:UNVERIFIED_CONTAM: hypothetical protein GTU68_017762 [Idotea baltica]|nr:hypothetical protein [Idotea baltica]